MQSQGIRVALSVLCLFAAACQTADRDMVAGNEALQNANWQSAIAHYKSAADRFRSDKPPSKRYALGIYYQADAMLIEPMSESAPEAEASVREALGIWDTAVGPRRLSTFSFLSRIAQAQQDQNDPERAEALYRLSDEIAAEKMPIGHRLLLAASPVAISMNSAKGRPL